MKARRPRTGVRGAASLIGVLCMAVCLTPGARAQNDSEDAGSASSPPPGLLDGVDLDLPSQAAFDGWPQAALLERPYWLPWTSAAFRRAELFDRPVLFVLSVPWSRNAQRVLDGPLSDGSVLRVANRDYVSVLVHADRRPDLAQRYGTGNWPVVALLTADGTPMVSQRNERGIAQPITIGDVDVDTFRFLLEEGGEYHRLRGNFLRGLGAEWARREGNIPVDPGAVDETASDSLARWLLGNADPEGGGFGLAPKYLVPGLTEYAGVRSARQVPALAAHAELSVRKILEGPLHDRRNGGIHRLAAAPGWDAVQYEKLLDRNAAFLRELVFLARARPGDERILDAIAGTIRFLDGTLARPGGGYFQAQVADPGSDDGGGWWREAGPAEAAPPVDPLVLSGPNAEAGAALLRAARLLGESEVAARGRAALDLVLARAHRSGNGVRHVVEPAPDEDRFLESQAEVAFAVLDAFETTGDRRYLDAGREIVDFASANLSRPGETGLWDRLVETGDVGLLRNPRRPPRPNARMARAMLRLDAHGVGDGIYREQAIAILGTFSGNLVRYGVQATELALAIEEAIRSPLVLRVEGPPGDPRVEALRSRAVSAPWTWTVVTTAVDGASREPGLVAFHRGVETRLNDAAAIDSFFERLAGLTATAAAP